MEIGLDARVAPEVFPYVRRRVAGLRTILCVVILSGGHAAPETDASIDPDHKRLEVLDLDDYPPRTASQ